MANSSFILPDAVPQGPVCPVCESNQYSGRMLNGVVALKCKKCKNEWYGGLPRVREDPLRPLPPETYVPPVILEKSLRKNSDEYVEIRTRRVDPTPSFRKGALIPPDGDK